MLTPVTMHKAEKYAVRKTALDKKQREFFLQNFGCARKIYNLYTDFLYTELERLGYTGGCVLPDIKLPEVSAFKNQARILVASVMRGIALNFIIFVVTKNH